MPQISGPAVVTPGNGNSMPYAAFQSVAFVAPIPDGHNNIITFEPYPFGAGGITGLTLTDVGDGPDTDFVFTETGQYLIAVNFVGGGPCTSLSTDPRAVLEVGIFNSEADIWLVEYVIGSSLPGASTTDIFGFYESDVPPSGFAVQLRPRDMEYQPPEGDIRLKIVKLT